MSSAELQTAHLFISYSHRNADFVEKFRQNLIDNGVSVWIDKIGLKPGSPDWEQAVRDAIRTTNGVLLVASPDSRRSPYVRDELAIAKMHHKVIYPIWAKGDEWMECIPMGLGHTQFADLRGDAYDDGLRELLATLNDEAISLTVMEPDEPPTDVSADFKPTNPYKGLKAFRAEDRAYFFGRDDLIGELIEAIEDSNFLAVVGPSGSGKSSVVMAGLLPVLQDGAVDHSEAWHYLPPMVPGTHPLENLTIALASALPDKPQHVIASDLAERSTRGLYRLARQVVDGPDGRLVLYIDQFEELFTLTQSEEERRQFIDLLTTAVQEPASPLLVILTLRADFYDRPMQYTDLGALLEAHSKSVLPMGLADLYDVVQKPAQLPDVQLSFDEGLVPELVFAVRDEAGALPLLQFTLDQLYQARDGQRLTREAYESLGGVRGALARHAEAIYQKLPSAEHQKLARALFLRLIEPGTTEQDTTRRRAALSELTLPDAEQTAMLREVQDRFVNARLLTTDHIGDEDTIEVSHEALIREWQRLSDWLRNAREDVRFQKALSADTAAWQRRDQPEDMLYRGIVLQEAQAWMQRNTPSAAEVAFLQASEQTEAERIAYEEKRARQVRNFQRAAGILAVFVILAIAAAIVAGITANDARQDREAANREVRQANIQVSRSEATSTAVAVNIATSQAKLETNIAEGEAYIESLRLAGEVVEILSNPAGNAEAATLLAIRALQQAYSPQADAALVRATDRLSIIRTFPSHLEAVTSVAFSPNGMMVLTGSDDDTARLWEVETGEMLRTFAGHTGDVASVAFSPDGTRVLTGSWDDTARLWEVETGELLRTFASHTGSVSSVAFSPDGTRVLTGSWDGTARLWEVETGEMLRTFAGHTGRVLSVAFSPDGTRVLTGSNDDTARLWEAETGEPLRTFGHTTGVLSVAFSPDGTRVLTGSGNFFSGDDTARLWDVETGEMLRTFTGHTHVVSSVAFSPDGTRVLTGSYDGTARLWEAETGELLRAFVGHSDDVYSVAFSPDGTRVLTGSADNTARLWDIEPGELRRMFSGHSDDVASVAFSPDGTRVLTGSDDDTARLWEAETGELLRTFAGHASDVTSVAFSPDGTRVLTGSYDGTARLWAVETGEMLRTFADHTDDVATAIILDLDGMRVLSDDVWSVAFSPDGTRVLTGSYDGVARLWEAETGELLRTFAGYTGGVSVAFSPDGTSVLTGSGSFSDDNTARLWDVETGELRRMFAGHTGGVTSVAFSPDGTMVLTGSRDNTARLWDAQTGAEIRTLVGHTGAVTRVAFSPDGTRVLTGSDDGTARLWDTDYRDFITYACTRVFRDLTDEERNTYGIPDDEPTCSQFATEN